MHKTHDQRSTIADSVRGSHFLSMTPAQCRAARALLQWSQDDLAREAGINAVTLRNYENGKTAAQRASIRVLRQALEKAGAVFLDDGSHTYAGVDLSKTPSPPEQGQRHLYSGNIG
jgi:transcriptional regulator with XRE-family HTH domain